jgi:FKBP12-rapamycin complex-associated protein
MLLDMDEIFPIFLSAMQDKSSTTKREAAVKSLVEILKNTGFVVLPYFKYLNLLEIILSLMKNEVNSEMRLHCMRLMGCIGAIDIFFYKKVYDKIRSRASVSPLEDNRALVNYIVNKSFRKRFKYMKKLAKS